MNINFIVVKFVLACLIVLIHTGMTFNSQILDFLLINFLNRLAVPIFFSISGYLFFKNNVLSINNKGKILKYFKTIFVYTVIFQIIWNLLYYFLFHSQYSTFSLLTFIQYCLCLGSTNVLCSCPHLWFLPALCFALYLTRYLVLKTNDTISFVILSLLYIIGIRNLDLYMNIFDVRFLIAPIFVYIGYICHRLPKLSLSKNVILFIIFIMLDLFNIYLLNNGNNVINNSTEYRITMPPLVFFLFLLILKWNNKTTSKLWIFVNDLSLSIYLYHFISIVCVSTFVTALNNTHILNNTFFMWFLYIFFTILLSLFLYQIKKLLNIIVSIKLRH